MGAGHYLATEDEFELLPLTQRQVASAIREHPSVVSRAIRGKTIGTPVGSLFLQALCQHTGQLVGRLAAAYPEATDREISTVLLDKYGLSVARRTVNYHRCHRTSELLLTSP